MDVKNYLVDTEKSQPFKYTPSPHIWGMLVDWDNHYREAQQKFNITKHKRPHDNIDTLFNLRENIDIEGNLKIKDTFIKAYGHWYFKINLLILSNNWDYRFEIYLEVKKMINDLRPLTFAFNLQCQKIENGKFTEIFKPFNI
jgi:hypothetical protein